MEGLRGVVGEGLPQVRHPNSLPANGRPANQIRAYGRAVERLRMLPDDRLSC
jgi:hypothetical protein